MRYILAIIVLMVVFSSCEKMLMEQPKTQVSTEQFYKTEKDALMALTGAYARLKADNGYYRQMLLSNLVASSDQGKSSWKHGDYYNGIINSTDATLTSVWQEIYQAVRDANNVIHNVPQIEMDDTLKNRIVGEAKFLRALHYFNLVRCWGEVPLRTIPMAKDDVQGLPLSSLTDIYSLIISDLKYAEENCWNFGEARNGTINNIGRATVGAANGMLAKVYLHIASSVRSASEGNEGCEPYAVFGSDYISYYDSTLYYSNLTINNPDFELVASLDEWKDIFSPINGNNSEILFDVQGSSATEQGTAIANLFSPENSGLAGGGWGGTNRLVAGFLKGNVNVNDPRVEHSLVHEFSDNQFNWVITSGLSGYDRFFLESGEKKNTVYYVFTAKYIDPSATTEYTSQQNWHVLRLADIYLIRAEALAEINNNPALAESDINILKTRISAEDLFVGAGMSMTEFRDALMRERGAELYFEGQRWFDLTRMGLLEPLINSAFDSKGQGVQAGVRGPEDYTWPIPISETATNDMIED